MNTHAIKPPNSVVRALLALVFSVAFLLPSLAMADRFDQAHRSLRDAEDTLDDLAKEVKAAGAKKSERRAVLDDLRVARKAVKAADDLVRDEEALRDIYPLLDKTSRKLSRLEETVLDLTSVDRSERRRLESFVVATKAHVIEADLKLSLGAADGEAHGEPHDHADHHPHEGEVLPPPIVETVEVEILVMAPETYKALLSAVEGEAFADGKLRVLSSALVGHGVTCAQVVGVMEKFSFDDDKVSAAAAMHPFVVDIENWFTVYSGLTFDSSKASLEAAVGHP